MRKLHLLMMTMIGIFLLPLPTEAYVTDGLVNDWGINLTRRSRYKGYLDRHLPSGGNDIDYITEDNADHRRNYYLAPGYSVGNNYDAEAMYFDNDDTNAYIAIITGVSPYETKYPAGDIFFDMGTYFDPLSATYDPTHKKYEYGMDIKTGILYKTESWVDVEYPEHAEANPWRMGDKKSIIDAFDLVYSTNPTYSHYIIEATIPLIAFDIYPTDPEMEKDIWLSWTMKCGNDHLKYKADINRQAHTVPEPTTLALLGSGLVSIYFRRRKKK